MEQIMKVIYNRPKLKSAIIISVYVLLMVIAAVFFNKFVDQETLQEFINQSGVWGVFIFFLVEVFYVTFTPLLNTFVLIAAGYLFGGFTGFIINFLATSTGLLLIVLLVKKYGRPLLQKVVPPRYYERFDEIIQKIGPMTLLIVYVLPLTPDDELTYILAAGPIGLKRFILPIILGTIAKSAYSYIGDLGAEGLTIAVYFRIVLLILGILLVGLQEYYIKRKGQNTIFGA